MNTPVETSAASRNRFEEQWHYRPDTPIQSSPIFEWPPKPLVIWRWFADRWLVFGENIVLVVLALVSWNWFQPSLEVTRTFSFAQC